MEKYEEIKLLITVYTDWGKFLKWVVYFFSTIIFLNLILLLIPNLLEYESLSRLWCVIGMILSFSIMFFLKNVINIIPYKTIGTIKMTKNDISILLPDKDQIISLLSIQKITFSYYGYKGWWVGHKTFTYTWGNENVMKIYSENKSIKLYFLIEEKRDYENLLGFINDLKAPTNKVEWVEHSKTEYNGFK